MNLDKLRWAKKDRKTEIRKDRKMKRQNCVKTKRGKDQSTRISLCHSALTQYFMSIKILCKSFPGVLRPRYLYFDVKFGLQCPFFAKQVVNAAALIKQSVQVPISTLVCSVQF